MGNLKSLLLISGLLSVNSAIAAPVPDPSQFDDICYLARYPDVVSSWVNKKDKLAIDHWNQHGKAEGRIPGCSANQLPITMTANFPNSLTIRSEPAEGSPIEITSFPKALGGAIGSVKWKGVEFINRADRGRELQSAISYDDNGECYNPTEAGTHTDKKDTSSSVLRYVKYSPGVWENTAQMAFWLYGDRVGGGCKDGPQVSTPFSKTLINKNINMNYKGDSAVIEYIVSFKNPVGVPKQKTTYELLTGYLTTDFHRFYEINPSNLTMVTVDNFIPLTSPGYPNSGSEISQRDDHMRPIIASNQAGSHAMGAFFPKQSIPGVFHGYELFKFGIKNGATGGPQGKGTTKWSIVASDTSPNQSLRTFRVLLIVGSLNEVSAKLKSLMATEGIQP